MEKPSRTASETPAAAGSKRKEITPDKESEPPRKKSKRSGNDSRTPRHPTYHPSIPPFRDLPIRWLVPSSMRKLHLLFRLPKQPLLLLPQRQRPRRRRKPTVKTPRSKSGPHWSNSGSTLAARTGVRAGMPRQTRKSGRRNWPSLLDGMPKPVDRHPNILSRLFGRVDIPSRVFLKEVWMPLRCSKKSFTVKTIEY
jgi:hypothetical protein